ncbi:MAG: DNA polymerase III subunit delta [Vicinamibacterales bacterium]
MPTLSLAALRAGLASGALGPLYVLTGGDDLEKLAVAGEFAETVDEGLRAFNVERLHGAETDVDQVTTAAGLFPMLSPRRIVIVLEAEKLLVPKRESRAAEAEQARLEALLADPPATTTLVFVSGPLDQRRRVVKRLLHDAKVVDCGTVADAASAEQWVRARAARDGVPLQPAAVRALAERAGLDIVRLRAGLERVGLYALGQATVTAADVRDAVAAGAEAQADFGVAKAIWRNDAAEALRELGLLLDAGAAGPLVLGQLRAAAEKSPPARLRAAIEAVFRTDLALKSSGGDPRVLLERLVVELCEPPRAGGTMRRRF